MFERRLYSGCYYLGGYAVECGLKACICKNVRRWTFPPRADYVRNRIYTHDLQSLVIGADLADPLEAKRQADAAFERYWQVVTGWSEEDRYSRHSRSTARDLLEAIENEPNGVMRWIRTHW